GIAVETMVVSMAASAIEVIRAISTGRRCARRGWARLAGWGLAGWTEAVIALQLRAHRAPGPESGPAAGLAPAGQDVGADRGQQHQGEDQVLRRRAHPQEVDAVVDGRDDDPAEHAVQRLAAAAEQAGPADHRGGHRVQHE